MKVSDLSPENLVDELRVSGVRLRTGPLVARVISDAPAVALGLALHYSDHPLEAGNEFADFHISVERPRNFRRWLQPQVLFHVDGRRPFHPLPADQAFAMLEWGLNWCIFDQCHQFLIIHSAVVERFGLALLLPAPPGSGKSTLCAGLVSRGWRLLSDELTLIDPTTGLVAPLARPIGLKNEAIGVMRDFSPDAVIGPTVRDTVKGAVAHMKPPVESVRRAGEHARVRWIAVPRYRSCSPACLTPLSRAEAFMHLADNSFNYDLHGKTGFEVLERIVDTSDCYAFTYSNLEEACVIFEDLCCDA